MTTQTPARPGEVLRTDYLERLGISADDLATSIGMPPGRMQEILVGRRAISADTATRLADRLGTAPEFWTKLQAAFDLSIVRQTWQQRRESRQKQPRRRR
jgi:addiction module HigA family antidote